METKRNRRVRCMQLLGGSGVFTNSKNQTSHFMLSQNKPRHIPFPFKPIILHFKSISFQQPYRRNIIGGRKGKDRFQMQYLEPVLKYCGERFLHNALVLIEGMKFIPNFRSSLIA